MVVYTLVFALLAILAIAYSRLARILNIVDLPNERSSHTFPVIRGGGVLFFCAALIFFFQSDFQYPSFIAGLTILSVLSFTDDVITLKAKLRLPFQFLAIFFILNSFQLEGVPYWALILTSIVGVGFINIYNFMDGINGITGMYSLAVLHGFWLLSFYEQNLIDSKLPIFTVLALLVFGYFNFRAKAKFFAGDVGSVSIAAIILFIGLKFLEITQSPLIFALVAVYGIDAGYTILRRIQKRENIFKPHRQHLYQQLVDVKKISHLKISAGYALVQLSINHIIFFLFSYSLEVQYIVAAGLFLLLSIIYFALLYWIKIDAPREIETETTRRLF